MAVEQRSRWGWGALCAAGLVFSLWLHLRLQDMGFDDTWIHLRIARNLLNTGHAWFNANERVMATSSPLWTLLMAAVHVPAWPGVLPWLEALLYWGACVLTFQVARRTLHGQREWVRDAVATLAAVFTAVLLVTSSVGQMETPLAVVFCLAAWLAAQRGLTVALPLLALASVTRLELLPVWAVATLAALLVGWRRTRVGVLEGMAIIAAMVVWTAVQFHVLLPNSMRAKQISYDLSFAATLHQFVNARSRDYAAVLLLAALVALTAWVLRGTGRQREGWRAWLPLCSAVSGVLVLVEYVVRRTVVFEWYRPLYLLPLVLGVLLLVPRRGGPALRAAWVAAQVFLLYWCLPTPLGWFTRAVHAAAVPTVAVKSLYDGGDYVRVQEYLQVGAVLARECPGARMMASEIGALGWTFPGEVLDSFGIASPAALQWQPLRSGAPKGGIPVGFLLQARPDVVVSYTVMSYEAVSNPAVKQNYDLLLLPTSPRSHRGGGLDIAWRSSPNLDVWLRRRSGCDRDAVKQALHAQVD